mmetsp:Transcript_40046/g.84092  ORF Transcript_40046/g.84092 Transcript_40046/m.84092 type:complete len:227 (-) Transcript_40046:182-862(-)
MDGRVEGGSPGRSPGIDANLGIADDTATGAATAAGCARPAHELVLQLSGGRGPHRRYAERAIEITGQMMLLGRRKFLQLREVLRRLRGSHERRVRVGLWRRALRGPPCRGRQRIGALGRPRLAATFAKTRTDFAVADRAAHHHSSAFSNVGKDAVGFVAASVALFAKPTAIFHKTSHVIIILILVANRCDARNACNTVVNSKVRERQGKCASAVRRSRRFAERASR